MVSFATVMVTNENSTISSLIFTFSTSNPTAELSLIVPKHRKKLVKKFETISVSSSEKPLAASRGTISRIHFPKSVRRRTIITSSNLGVCSLRVEDEDNGILLRFECFISTFATCSDVHLQRHIHCTKFCSIVKSSAVILVLCLTGRPCRSLAPDRHALPKSNEINVRWIELSLFRLGLGLLQKREREITSKSDAWMHVRRLD